MPLRIIHGDISWCPTIVPIRPSGQQPFEEYRRYTQEDKFIVLKAAGTKAYSINRNKSHSSTKILPTNAKPNIILPNLFIRISFIKILSCITRSKPEYIYMNIEKPYLVVPEFAGVIKFYLHGYGSNFFKNVEPDDLEHEHEYMCDCCNKGSLILTIKEHGNFCLNCCSIQTRMDAEKITYNGDLYMRICENFSALDQLGTDFFCSKRRSIQELTNPRVYDAVATFYD